MNTHYIPVLSSFVQTKTDKAFVYILTIGQFLIRGCYIREPPQHITLHAGFIADTFCRFYGGLRQSISADDFIISPCSSSTLSLFASRLAFRRWNLASFLSSLVIIKFPPLSGNNLLLKWYLVRQPYISSFAGSPNRIA